MLYIDKHIKSILNFYFVSQELWKRYLKNFKTLNCIYYIFPILPLHYFVFNENL